MKRLRLVLHLDAVLLCARWRPRRLSRRRGAVLGGEDLVQLVLQRGDLLDREGAPRSLLGEALHRRLVRALRVPSPWVGCEPVLRQLDRLFRLDKTLLLLYRPRQVGGRLGAPVEAVVILVEAGGRDVGRLLGGVLDLLSEERLQVLDRLVPAPQPAVALPPGDGEEVKKI